MKFWSVDYLIMVLISVILIVGVYQFYFWCQRQSVAKRKGLMTPIDRWFGYRPSWVWIYSGLYYPIIVFMTLTISDFRHYASSCFAFLSPLIFGILFLKSFRIKLLM